MSIILLMHGQSEKMTAPLGQMDYRGCNIFSISAASDRFPTKYPFCIRPAPGADSSSSNDSDIEERYLCAETAEERDKWIAVYALSPSHL